MFRQTIFTILTAAALTSGCQKIDLGTPVDGTPVFSAKFTAGGAEKDWKAGVDGYYLFTSFEKGTDDVYTFTGQFKQDSCSTGVCGESLTVKIRDFQQIINSTPDVTQAVAPGNYQYMFQAVSDTLWILDTTTIYQLTFDAGPSVIPPNAQPLYTWTLSNNIVVQSGQIATLALPQWPSDLTMTLTLQANNQSCSSTQTRRVTLPNPIGPQESCSVFIDTVLDSNIISSLVAIPSGSAPFSFIWQDSTIADMWEVSNFVQEINANVSIADAEGCTASASYFTPLSPGAIGPYCSARFSYQVTELTQVDSTPVMVNDSLQFSTVLVEYTNSTGEHFSSVISPQSNANAYFEILSAEDYEDNENGQKTKKLSIRFACRLWSANGNYINLQNGEAVMGVAYP